jgi:hypothetical protein
VNGQIRPDWPKGSLVTNVRQSWPFLNVSGGLGLNARLKKLLAEQMLDNAMPKDVAAKKW